MCPRPLNEIQEDLNDINYIECLLQSLQLLLRRLIWICVVSVSFLVIRLVLLREHENKRSNKQVIHYYESDNEVPDLAGCPLLIDEVPLELALI